VLVPGTENPTTVDQLGTPIEASGFANPYAATGVSTKTGSTAGLAWCDPEPAQQEPGLLKETVTYPTAPTPCPQPLPNNLGGQGKDTEAGAPSTSAPREASYVNASPGRQLAVAWEGPAHMSMSIPAKSANVSNYRALYLSTAVNFFDPRNPSRGTLGIENPLYAPQNFTIAVTDAEGHEATVEAGNPLFGTALQQTLGNTSYRVHVVLQDLRVPLAEFSKQGVNLAKLRKLELRFGGAGMPSSGSIELSNIRFQQPATGYSNVYLESTEPNAGPGNGVLTSGPNGVKEFEEGVYKRANGEYEIPNVTRVPGANVWTVSNNGSCPNAQFKTIQEAVNQASPWDTIVVCPGTYEESSKPINSEPNPVATGEMDGLTINKPLKIIGAGANLVTIKPAASLATLGGASGTLRNGGGNVITVSRQSLGSTDYDEMYVDISGVKIESGSTTAEAGVAFFNTSGRIADSEIGTIKPVNGNGWGVVATNSILASPVEHTPERNVTLENDVIKGYTSGGVLIDDSQGGVDGASTNTVRSNMGEAGYIKGTRIEGSGGTSTVAQTGVAYRSGASGEVTNSSITKNQSTSGSSYGVLAADAGTLTVKGSNITGNGAPGYALYNANAAVTGVSTGSAIEATGDFWGGSTGAPKTGESVLGASEEEGVEGPVTDTPFAAAALTYPTESGVPAMPTSAPGGSIVNPANGESVEAGAASKPVVTTEDPSVVHSVSLKANGESVGVDGSAPYTFSWTPTKAEVGTTVELEATITNYSGQATVSTIKVPVVATAETSSSPQGTWAGTYGEKGYDLAAWNNGSDVVSPGLSVSLNSGSRYVWASETSDTRALANTTGSARVASCYYSPGKLEAEVKFTAAYTGNLELYAVDWDSKGRSETIEAGGYSATLSNFSGGEWVTIPVTQAANSTLLVTVTKVGGPNAVLSGIFLGGGGTPPAFPIIPSQAPQGSWAGTYGEKGYDLAAWNEGTDAASDVSATLTHGSRYVWESNTSDTRALANTEGTARTAATYYDPSKLEVELKFSSAYSGNLELYAVDWDSQGRSETIEVAGQTVSLANFAGGDWITVPVTQAANSTLVITVTKVGGPNAVLSGILLGGGGTPPAFPTKAPQGTWVGTYGAQGSDLAAWNEGSDVLATPGVSVSTTNASRYVWAPETTDVRALENAAGTKRVAATYYSAEKFEVELKFSSAYSGNLELYAVDWDSQGRSETIEVGGQTYKLSHFTQGDWVKIPITQAEGSTLTITVTDNTGPNAVLSGIFLG
jgi:hypothetical protein